GALAVSVRDVGDDHRGVQVAPDARPHRERVLVAYPLDLDRCARPARADHLELDDVVLVKWHVGGLSRRTVVAGEELQPAGVDERPVVRARGEDGDAADLVETEAGELTKSPDVLKGQRELLLGALAGAAGHRVDAAHPGEGELVAARRVADLFAEAREVEGAEALAGALAAAGEEDVLRDLADLVVPLG